MKIAMPGTPQKDVFATTTTTTRVVTPDRRESEGPSMTLGLPLATQGRFRDMELRGVVDIFGRREQSGLEAFNHVFMSKISKELRQNAELCDSFYAAFNPRQTAAARSVSFCQALLQFYRIVNVWKGVVRRELWEAFPQEMIQKIFIDKTPLSALEKRQYALKLLSIGFILQMEGMQTKVINFLKSHEYIQRYPALALSVRSISSEMTTVMRGLNTLEDRVAIYELNRQRQRFSESGLWALSPSDDFIPSLWQQAPFLADAVFLPILYSSVTYPADRDHLQHVLSTANELMGRLQYVLDVDDKWIPSGKDAVSQFRLTRLQQGLMIGAYKGLLIQAQNLASHQEETIEKVLWEMMHRDPAIGFERATPADQRALHAIITQNIVDLTLAYNKAVAPHHPCMSSTLNLLANLFIRGLWVDVLPSWARLAAFLVLAADFSFDATLTTFTPKTVLVDSIAAKSAFALFLTANLITFGSDTSRKLVSELSRYPGWPAFRTPTLRLVGSGVTTLAVLGATIGFNEAAINTSSDQNALNTFFAVMHALFRYASTAFAADSTSRAFFLLTTATIIAASACRLLPTCCGRQNFHPPSPQARAVELSPWRRREAYERLPTDNIADTPVP